MTIPILRSIGQQLHPVGPLTIANYLLNPNLELATSGDINYWTKTNCTFVQNSSNFVYGLNGGKLTTTSTSLMPSVKQNIAIQQQVTYIFSASVKITSTLTSGISVFAVCYDLSGSVMPDVIGGLLVGPAITSGFIRPSILLQMPVGAATADITITRSAQPSSLDSFYLDGLQLESGDTAGPYVDGDMSGYVWATTPGNSQTIQSEFPDALSSFNTFPLQGGMGAGAGMYGRQHVPLVD
jgi:hypothetical protein